MTSKYFPFNILARPRNFSAHSASSALNTQIPRNYLVQQNPAAALIKSIRGFGDAGGWGAATGGGSGVTHPNSCCSCIN